MGQSGSGGAGCGVRTRAVAGDEFFLLCVAWAGGWESESEAGGGACAGARAAASRAEAQSNLTHQHAGRFAVVAWRVEWLTVAGLMAYVLD